MKGHPNEEGSTRPRMLLGLVGFVLLGGFAALLAQNLRITAIKETQPGQLAVEYQSDTPGRFRLLRGSTVTNITTPVATNDAHTVSGRFLLPIERTNSAAF